MELLEILELLEEELEDELEELPQAASASASVANGPYMGMLNLMVDQSMSIRRWNNRKWQ